MTTSRSERIRAWLATQDRPATTRDVQQAVDPTCDINAVCAALSTMVKAGLVIGASLGGRRYYVIGRPVKTQKGEPKPVKTGRAARVRAFLAAHDRGFSVAELRAELDPAAPSTRVSASLFTLAKQGHIHRAARGQLACYARTQALADRQLALMLTAKVEKPAPTPKPPRATVKPKPKATPAARPKRAAPAPPARVVPRTLGTPPPPSAAMRTAMNNSARSTSRPPPRGCALNGVSDAHVAASERIAADIAAFEAHVAASERIAADIAAFEARGGRIERLGPTQFFSHIGIEAANHAPPRRPRTGTDPQDD